jgi:hypothetical protein
VSAEALGERFNLAMVGTSFGQDARDLLERAYQTYQQVGGELEDAYRAVSRGSQPALDGLDRRPWGAGRHRLPAQRVHDDQVA